MNTVGQQVTSLTVRAVVEMIRRDPERNMPRLLEWARKFNIQEVYDQDTWGSIERAVYDPHNSLHQLGVKAVTELDPNVLNKLFANFVVNAGPVSSRKTAKMEEELGIKVPWAILMDPTAACNLKCIGCWAAEYGKESEMDDELISRIIGEGKELGIYFYAYTGGEPLVRKDSLIRLAQEHKDCVFMAFTNGTLVDEAFAAEMQRVGNLALAISVEGFEEETDMRRGRGTYQRVMKAMDILRDRGLLFGYSTCYHRYNTEVVGSEAYVDHMVAKGARFAWYFTYMPLGRDARPDLLAEPEQRAYMYRRIREVRATHSLFAMDFWNDGEYVEGCIAGGRKYFHINANGDVEPCAFIHYADVNIHDVSLLEALRSPLFMAYQRNQPFNSNHLRPCPLLDNPAALEQMVRETGAESTQPGDHEDVASLCAKCHETSRRWATTADALWAARERRAAVEQE